MSEIMADTAFLVAIHNMNVSEYEAKISGYSNRVLPRFDSQKKRFIEKKYIFNLNLSKKKEDSIMSKNLIIENLKKQLSKGTKIIYFMKKESKDSGKLVRSTIPCGTVGHILSVDDDGSIHVLWNDHKESSIQYGTDLFEVPAF